MGVKVVVLFYTENNEVSVYSDDPDVEVRVVDMEPPADWAADRQRKLEFDPIDGEEVIRDVMVYDHVLGVDKPFVERVFALDTSDGD
jgi:hypothetical protein